MLVAFAYDNGATGALFYSREVPSLLRGLRTSKLYGREGVITFESNGAVVVARGRGRPRVVVPGIRDSGTSAATRRCTPTSSRPSGPAGSPR